MCHFNIVSLFICLIELLLMSDGLSYQNGDSEVLIVCTKKISKTRFDAVIILAGNIFIQCCDVDHGKNRVW
jgi:hypothetical protein